jgi:MFS transporter, FSR family, fosmidomycin resistance protein
MTPASKKKFQSGNVLLISIAHMVHDTYSAFLAPILPLLIEKFSLSLSQAGFLSVIGRLPSLLNPIIGILADRLSVRYFLIVSPSVTAVCMSCLGIAPGYIALAILVFVMGISSTLFHVPAPVMIKKVAGDRVGKGMSFYMVGGEMARSLGPLVILGAISLWGLEGSYRVVLFGVLASLVLYTRIKDIRISDEITENNNKAKTSLRKTMNIFMSFFIILAGISFTRSLLRGALTSFLPTFLNLEKNESLWLSGISLSLIQFTGAIGSYYCGAVSDKIGRKTTLMIVALSSPVLMVVFLMVEGVWVLPVLVLLGFTFAATTPVLLALVQDMESDRPAFLNSIFMTISFLLGALGIMLVGALGDWLGLEMTYWISAVMAFGAVPFILKIKKQ